MQLERAGYEASPYFYAAVGTIATIDRSGLPLLNASGLVLLVTALVVVRLRWIHRRRGGHGDFDVDPKKYVALITQDLFHDASPPLAPSAPHRRRS